MKLLLQNPVHHQLAPDWKYVRSDKTDIRKTFKRVRERMIAEQKTKPNKVREIRAK
jgi:hypothetical protein